MAGCRALNEDEVIQAMDKLKTKRDKALFILGIKTGYRISELLSLTIADALNTPELTIKPSIRVYKRNMKGKPMTREIPLHRAAIEALGAYIRERADSGPLMTTDPLFLSKMKRPLSRYQAHNVLKDAYKAAGLGGHLATHTCRKTFAKKVYKALDHDIIATSKALGHASITNTVKYLEPDKETINSAILAD